MQAIEEESKRFSQSLQLTAHPKHWTPEWGSWGSWKHQARPVWKRFEDAELYAEYWRGEADMATEVTGAYKEDDRGGRCTWSLWGGDIERRLNILHRFATHPHYDERSDDD